ncbi:amidohydrolase family protein [Amycolatopsis cynarae]|uniref:Amidohydrolase family protein n=1 Tax=Amycolatopsis cynarae TaxID=2995223 RepID=A0ABY7BA40_9PSEU|nr:amidohydrolase family protein [Amycolatopsis sp. HUAS 11-8]WAL67726.1 amidohydrolase family protein [Amycolatopsis sp. HUAS 11-8]
MEAITIENVRVFDGTGLTAPRSVHFDGGRITACPPPGARTVDGRGGTLLPGLIDTHVHVETRAALEECARWGVTTAFDMAAAHPGETLALRHLDGLTDLFSAGYPALAPDSGPIKTMGFPDDIAVSGIDAVEGFIASRVRDGVDYLKILVEDPELPDSNALAPETVTALVRSAHQHGLKVIAHATTGATYRVAVEAGTDIVTHTPMNAVLSADLARMVPVASPTLGMMRGMCRAFEGRSALPMDYENARESVRRLHEVGVTILAGTDANANPFGPLSRPYGETLHEELQLLVDAGLSPVEALRAATSTPVEVFGLPDRGVVDAGRRADLLLVDGDPTADIQATTRIRHVWIGGTQVR